MSLRCLIFGHDLEEKQRTPGIVEDSVWRKCRRCSHEEIYSGDRAKAVNNN